VDLQEFEVTNNELLFILPHQIHQLPAAHHSTNYFKVSFDENCLSLLAKQYAFWVNPPNNQKVTSVFKSLLNLWQTMDTDPELILAYLNSLMGEINAVYLALIKSRKTINSLPISVLSCW
jgi:AraC family transcriptional activator of pobA